MIPPCVHVRVPFQRIMYGLIEHLGELAARPGPLPSSTEIERPPLERVSRAAVVLKSGPRKSTSHDGRTC